MQLLCIYKEFNPNKMETVDELLARYQGQEADLLRKVYKKYQISQHWLHTALGQPLVEAADVWQVQRQEHEGVLHHRFVQLFTGWTMWCQFAEDCHYTVLVKQHTTEQTRRNLLELYYTHWKIITEEAILTSIRQWSAKRGWDGVCTAAELQADILKYR